MLKQELNKRNLPPLKSREEMMEILQREEYGYLPENNFEISVSNEKLIESRFDKGNVALSVVDFTLTNQYGSHTFPVHRMLHKDGKKHPLVIYTNFHTPVPNNYFPTEELSETEFDFLTFNYTDVTSDDMDFTNGIAGLIFPNGRQTDTDCGKIMMWAFTNMRVLDYALTLPGTDADNITIAGHSRLGKTALVTGMMDTRFSFVCSNNAGCSGDALSRGGSGLPDENGNFAVEKEFRGETVSFMIDVLPQWFCKNYYKYKEQNFGTDFDQHFLLACIAPRNVCVNAAELDFWADQKSEQLCCLAAGEMWENMGLMGLQEFDHYLEPKESLLEGNVGFFMSPTMHFMSRYAWGKYLEFIRKHRHN